MPVITVEPELYRRVEEAAQEHKASIDEILAEALRLYLWEEERRKIEQEGVAYRRQHEQIKGQYLGQYIAMREGQIVDHDPDFTTLHQRIRQQYGLTPVMITLVEEQPERPLTRRGFQEEGEWIGGRRPTKEEAYNAGKQLKEFQKDKILGDDLSIKDLINEGRRY